MARYLFTLWVGLSTHSVRVLDRSRWLRVCSTFGLHEVFIMSSCLQMQADLAFTHHQLEAQACISRLAA